MSGLDGPDAARWAHLRRRAGTGEWVASELRRDGAPTGLWMAVDSRGDLHMLIPTDRAAVPDPGLPGCAITTRVLPELGRVLDLRAPSGLERPFTALGRTIAEGVVQGSLTAEDALRSALVEGRRFWGAARHEEEQLQSFGALWFLSRQLRVLGPALVQSWSGPPGPAFVGPSLAVEVLVVDGTESPFPVVGLDRLAAPPDRALAVVAVRVERGGSMEADDLIRGCEAALAGDLRALELLHSRLVTRAPVGGGGPVEILSADLYLVDERFPAIREVPEGLVWARYAVDLSGLRSLSSSARDELLRGLVRS